MLLVSVVVRDLAYNSQFDDSIEKCEKSIFMWWLVGKCFLPRMDLSWVKFVVSCSSHISEWGREAKHLTKAFLCIWESGFRIHRDSLRPGPFFAWSVGMVPLLI